MQVKCTEGLSPEEESTLIMLLGRVGKAWSMKFYLAICRLVCLTAVETVFYRWCWGKKEVLLPKRSPQDPVWPGQPHSPGSMLYGSDAKGSGLSAFGDAIKRACGEIGVDSSRITKKLAGFLTQNTKRGPELGVVLACNLCDEKPEDEAFFPIDKLPGDIIDHHSLIIEIAKKKFD